MACAQVDCPGQEALRDLVTRTLTEHGLSTNGTRGQVRELSKSEIRNLNHEAVRVRQNKARSGLARHEDQLLARFAIGSEIDPLHIQPRLVEVASKSEDELLFRYARLHWSIPVSAGYGRRLRFLVIDEQNDKLIGIFGLGDPVFSIGPRDTWVGWDTKARQRRLRHVMDAFVLGAVAPYNYLLCGKLVALLATSDEVREVFRTKYAGKVGLISEDDFSGELAMITTASALGKSSLYNRLTFEPSGAAKNAAKREKIFVGVGFTAGSGEFHFANGTYQEMLAYAEHHCAPSSKHAAWGGGWRNRREVVRAVLGSLGLSRELVYHGIQRELYVAPLASNAREFLRGETDQLDAAERSAAEASEYFRRRWLVDRAATETRHQSFHRDLLRLWTGAE